IVRNEIISTFGQWSVDGCFAETFEWLNERGADLVPFEIHLEDMFKLQFFLKGIVIVSYFHFEPVTAVWQVVPLAVNECRFLICFIEKRTVQVVPRRFHHCGVTENEGGDVHRGS